MSNERKADAGFAGAHGSARCQEIQELEAQATRYENAVSSTSSPSSQEYVSPQRFDHYMKMARECREKAERLKAQNDKVSDGGSLTHDKH